MKIDVCEDGRAGPHLRGRFGDGVNEPGPEVCEDCWPGRRQTMRPVSQPAAPSRDPASRGRDAPKMARERLGHPATGVTPGRYSRVIRAMQREAAAKLDRALRSVITPRWKRVWQQIGQHGYAGGEGHSRDPVT